MTAGIVTLKIISGPLAGRTFTFESQDSLLVGRSGDAQVQIRDDQHISRNHFLIEVKPPNCHIVDLDSANGTYVNDERVADCWLSDGDTIRGGNTQISVHLDVENHLAETMVSTADEAATASSDIELDEQIGDYQIIEEIGSGSMGVVYKAKHIRSGDTVALKVVSPAMRLSEPVQQSFIREAGILCGLSHKRIVRFVEVGSCDNRLFMVMEFVETIDVEETLSKLSLNKRIKLACGMTMQMLDGLQYAHSQGLVHRDVKPRNLLVYKHDGRISAKLADFGLAKNFADAGMSQISSEHEIKGTLCFIAPEQIVSSRSVTPAADIFSAGATLYTMICGETIYDLSNNETPIASILNDGPVPLQTRCSEVPSALCRFVGKATSPKPEDRYSSAAEMHGKLQRMLKK